MTGWAALYCGFAVLYWVGALTHYDADKSIRRDWRIVATLYVFALLWPLALLYSGAVYLRKNRR
jgi:hypothetical protein